MIQRALVRRPGRAAGTVVAALFFCVAFSTTVVARQADGVLSSVTPQRFDRDVRTLPPAPVYDGPAVEMPRRQAARPPANPGVSAVHLPDSLVAIQERMGPKVGDAF